MKYIKLLLLALFLSFAMLSCGDSGGSSGEAGLTPVNLNDEDTMYGTYKIVEFETGGVIITPPELTGEIVADKAGNRVITKIQFYSAGRVNSYIYATDPISSGSSGPLGGSVTASGNTITFTDGSVTMVLEKVSDSQKAPADKPYNAMKTPITDDESATGTYDLVSIVDSTDTCTVVSGEYSFDVVNNTQSFDIRYKCTSTGNVIQHEIATDVQILSGDVNGVNYGDAVLISSDTMSFTNTDLSSNATYTVTLKKKYDAIKTLP